MKTKIDARKVITTDLIKLNTTYPDTTLPYNQWTIYISKQLN